MRRCIVLFRCLTAIALSAAGVGIAASAHPILLGVNTHVAGHYHEQQPQLELAHKIGFDAVRDAFLWQYAEPTRGVYKIPAVWDRFVNESIQFGLKPVVILCYGNKLYDGGNKPRSRQAIEAFVRYATFVVKHFAGHVHYFEIWNEWDTHAGGFPSGNARDYSRLFDAVYPAVKKIDPTAVFLASASAGGSNAWYEDIARLGVAALADGVSVHPYVYPRKPNTGSSLGTNEAEQSVEQVINIEATMRRFSGGKEIPLYITEIGWPTNVGRLGLAEKGTASLAQRALLMFSALPYVRGVWWYDLRDDCTDNARYLCRFGLAHNNLSLKPAAYAIHSIAALIKRNDLTFSRASDPGAGLVALKRNSSAPSVIAWNVEGTSQGGHKTGSGVYSISCAPSLKIARAARPASDLRITQSPRIFAYRGGHCTRGALPDSKVPINR